MADKKYVELKCIAKDLYDKALEKDLATRMAVIAKTAIDNKSGGTLTTKTKSKEGFLMTLELTIKADDKAKPTKLEGKIAIVTIAIGGTAKAFTGSANGKTDGFGLEPASAAADLVDALLGDLMVKAVKTLKGL